MQVYEYLHRDHEKVKELLEELAETTDRQVRRREDLFETLKSELDAHSKGEEKFFYNRLRDTEEAGSMVLESIEEHHVLDKLLQELDKMEKSHESWSAKLKVLHENVEHHVAEEEKSLFPKARKVFSGEESEQIAEEIESFKEGKTAPRH